VTILNYKTHLAYMLTDSGASHSFFDEHFISILGLVPKDSGFMVVRTIGGYSEKLLIWQVNMIVALKETEVI
jgi:hypothetical protein